MTSVTSQVRVEPVASNADQLLGFLETLSDDFCPEVVVEALRMPENESTMNHIIADVIEALWDEVRRLRLERKTND